MLDAENNQENADCQVEGNEEHSSFDVINPENLGLQNDSYTDSTYRKIELIENSKLTELTRKLDTDQRIVLDKAVAYAKDVIKPNIQLLYKEELERVKAC